MEWIFRALVLSLPLVLVIALISAIAARFRITVFEYQRGLRFRRGRLVGVLEPGAYWVVPGISRVDRMDVRTTRVPIAAQEVLTADGVVVKASLLATYRVVQPDRATLATDDYRAAVYSELQLALRAIVSELPVDLLLQQRTEIPARLKTMAGEKIRAFGVELEDASIRDLTFPGELKKIFAQVVKARQEGLAALERARGETAALRNLANAAQMVERTPALMQLRLIQVLGQQSGNTVVLGMHPGNTPIPVRGTPAPDLPTPPEPIDHT